MRCYLSLLMFGAAVAVTSCCDTSIDDMMANRRLTLNSMPYNTQWKSNNKLIKTLDMVYNSLAHVVEDTGDEQKQMFSILADSILQLMDHFSQGLGTKPGEFLNFVTNTIKEKAEVPADVVANKPRRALNLLRSTIDTPINLVKLSCTPFTTNATCHILLQHYVATETQSCQLYENHQNLYKHTIDLLGNPNFDGFVEKLVAASKRGTVDAAVAFMKSATVEDKFLLKDLYSWYDEFRSGVYPCRSLDSYSDNDMVNQPIVKSYF